MHAKPPVRHSVPLMSGSTDLDGAIFEVLGIFAGRDESSLVEDFTNVLRRFVPLDQHPSIAKILSLYGVSSTPGHAPGQVQLSILQFGTDLKYFASTQGYALSWPSKSWTYYFQEPNPWEGPHQGHSAHCLDIAYLFLNYKHLMSESQLEVAHTFARDVLSFVYGDAPWPEFRCSRKMRVYGKSQNSLLEQEIAEEGSAGPSSAIRKLWDEIGLDKLVDAWDAYLARR
jgi:carboxylesterase type B